MSDDLLPPNAKPQERALSLAIQRAASVPVPVRDVWNPDACPANLLPWLAWAFSVDEWDPNWTDAQKRAAIKSSIAVHKYKGTIGAVREALAALGYPAQIVEWFNQSPTGDPYTFDLMFTAEDVGFDLATIDRILGVVFRAKNLRSDLNKIHPSLIARAGPRVAAVTMIGSEITIEYGGPIDLNPGYPLDDDGTLAATFGVGFAAAAPPDYNTVTYTYTGSAAGGEAVTAPSAATALSTQAITVGSGETLGVEMRMVARPAGTYSVYIVAHEVNGGVLTGNVWAVGFANDNVIAIGSGDTPPTGIDVNGWHVGLDVQASGQVVASWGKPGQPLTYGSLVSAGSPFTAGRKITFRLGITDSGATTPGQTITIKALPNEAGMKLTHVVGAIDHNGNTIT